MQDEEFQPQPWQEVLEPWQYEESDPFILRESSFKPEEESQLPGTSSEGMPTLFPHF